MKIHKKFYAHCHLIVFGFILVRFIQRARLNRSFLLFTCSSYSHILLFRSLSRFHLLFALISHTHTRACIERIYVIWIAFFFFVCCCNSPSLFCIFFSFLCWIRRNHDLFRIERFSSLYVLQIHMFISFKHKALSRVKEEGNRWWDDKKKVHLKTSKNLT